MGAVYALNLAGSNNLIERVRHINSYGSWANLSETFGISLVAPAAGDATGNTIRYCRAEAPWGNYGSPFALHGQLSGITVRFMTNSVIYGNYAAGLNNGLPTGFTSGGVNSGFVKNLRIHDNIFVDCFSIYYQDTGSAEWIQILNNKLVRGWMGIGLLGIQPTWTKNNVNIAGNSFNMQNRIVDIGSVSYGIVTSEATNSNLSITGNYFSFTPTGQGYKQFSTMSATSERQCDYI